jgi:hypothetical protein
MDDPREPLARGGDALSTTTRLQTLAEVMRRVRPRFHRGLVAWYRDAGDPRGLERLEALFRKVTAGLGSGLLADLFGLAEIFATALSDGRLACDPGTRSLMGQLDRVLKPLAQQPPAWPEADARALIDRLLDRLGRLEPVHDSVVGLVAVYGSSEAIEAARGSGRDRSAHLEEEDFDRDGGRLAELAAVEEQLELIDRGGRVDPAALDAAYAALYEVVGLLDPTDTCRLAPLLAKIADQVKALVSADSHEQSRRLESLAADLLALEAILLARMDERALVATPPLGPGMDPAELTLAVMRELERELLGVTRTVSGARDEGSVTERQDEAGTMLGRIAGVLRLLGLVGAADLSAACGAWLRRRGVAPDARSVDVGGAALTAALACLSREIGAGLAGGQAVQAPTGCADQALIALARSIEQTPELTAPVAGMPPKGPSLPLASTPGEIAPELMEIFVEEIDEEISSARERLARWSLDRRDSAAATALKRNFSVIKGSGLLVGARSVAAVAEAVEGLLSRVAAQPTRDPAVTSFIAEVLDQLPVLVHTATEDPASVAAALIARAEHIAVATAEADLDVDGVSLLVPLDLSAQSDDALQIPIEDLLDTFEVAPEKPGEWALPDLVEGPDTDTTGARCVPVDSCGLSEQALAAELDLAFSAPGDPATEPMPRPIDDPTVAPWVAPHAETEMVSPVAALVEQVGEMARCHAELETTHAQLVSGLDALGPGLARLRDLVDRLASEGNRAGKLVAEGADVTDAAVGLAGFCGRAGEILDDLESVTGGLTGDRLASDETRSRQAKLLEAVSDALVKLNLESSG